MKKNEPKTKQQKLQELTKIRDERIAKYKKRDEERKKIRKNRKKNFIKKAENNIKLTKKKSILHKILSMFIKK